MQKKLHLVLTGSLKRLPAGITGHTQTRYKAYTGLASGDFWGSERGALCTPQYWEGVTFNCKDRTLLRGSCLTLALFIRWVRLRHHFDVFDSSSSFAFSSDSILAISCSAVARFWRPSS